jgi:hypothetical protein
MTRIWHELEGVSLARSGAAGDAYELERCLGTEQDTAFFGVAPAPERPRTVVKLMPADAAGAAEQLAMWNEIATLSHPHLLGLLDCGEGEAADGQWIYAAFEHPDDSLANAISSGTLGEQDAHDVLMSVQGALDYIHEKGLTHGAVDEEHVVAVGDRIKLTSDTLRYAFDTVEAQSADNAGLEALAQRIGAEFPAPKPAPEVPQQDREPVPPAVVSMAPVFATAEHEIGSRAPWLLLMGTVAALAIAVVLVATQRSSTNGTPAAPAAVAPSGPAASPVSLPEKRPPAPVQLPPAMVPALHKEHWRVVAYTYNHRGQAEKKARTVNRKWPGFQAGVFTPRGTNDPPFLVALGGAMDRDRAAALQKKARAKGLPRDTFIRNYSN